MRAYHTDRFVIPLPPGHPFPMDKYRRLRERVAAEASGVELHEGPAATESELLRAHDADYVRRVCAGRLSADEVRRIGFPWSPELVARSLHSCGATLAACRDATRDGVAAYLGGGTHHAFRDHGQGYCVFNDAACAALMLLDEGLARRVAIVDCDVHQGNGTAAILRDEPRAFTFSIHGARNFPREKESSDLDVELADDTGDDEYLATLASALETTFARSEPDFVVYLAGADPHAHDRLGRLALSSAGLRARDRMVLQRCRSAGVPVAITMAGGYGRDIDTTVAVHAGTIAEGAALS
ncbi:MAG: histone deacetylase [Planctomycetota bacterium]